MIVHWYWINLRFACFGLKVENSKIVSSPPIANWTIGKNISHILAYWKNREVLSSYKVLRSI